MVGLMKQKLYLLISFLLLLLSLAGCGLTDKIDKHVNLPQTKETTDKNIPKQQPLPFTKGKQWKLGDLDSNGRPTDAHIQLKFKDKPQSERNSRLEYNPPGWHNYKMSYKKDNGKIDKYWTFDRTHLVGYLFSGVNDEPKNLITGTVHLNRGTGHGMNSHDEKSMLYYEMRLNQWLKNHPNYKLDYQVTPLYQKDELVPREVRLSYTGYKNNGKHIPINIGSSLETKGNHATVVTLPNEEPNLDINYKTGMAKSLKK